MSEEQRKGFSEDLEDDDVEGHLMSFTDPESKRTEPGRKG